MTDFRKAILLFCLQVFLYGVNAFNQRSISEVNYLWTAITDMMIAGSGFFALFEIVSGANKLAKFMGYILGSMVGGVFGLYLSTFVL